MGAGPRLAHATSQLLLELCHERPRPAHHRLVDGTPDRGHAAAIPSPFPGSPAARHEPGLRQDGMNWCIGEEKLRDNDLITNLRQGTFTRTIFVFGCRRCRI